MVPSGTSVAETLEAMQAARRGYALVYRNGLRLAGIFTEHDVLLNVLGRAFDLNQPVDTVMTKDPTALPVEATLGDAMELMNREGHRRVPLEDGDGRLTGLLRQQDLLEYVAEAFPQEILNLPPRPHQQMEEPEGA